MKYNEDKENKTHLVSSSFTETLKFNIFKLLGYRFFNNNSVKPYKTLEESFKSQLDLEYLILKDKYTVCLKE